MIHAHARCMHGRPDLPSARNATGHREFQPPVATTVRVRVRVGVRVRVRARARVRVRVRVRIRVRVSRLWPRRWRRAATQRAGLAPPAARAPG